MINLNKFDLWHKKVLLTSSVHEFRKAVTYKANFEGANLSDVLFDRAGVVGTLIQYNVTYNFLYLPPHPGASPPTGQ